MWQWVWVTFFVLTPLTGGAICGFYENTLWGNKTGRLICSLLLAAAITMAATAFADGPSFVRIEFIAAWPPAIINGIFAGFFAARIRTQQTEPRCRHLLICWLAGPAWTGLYWAFICIGNAIFRESEKLSAIVRSITPLFSLPYGPYATLMATLGQWPNAGEFFSPWLAAILTLLMLLPAACFLLIKSRNAASLMLLIFATASTASLIIGFAQLLNCAE